ncbi:hypothetical protein QUA08_27005 [Microcoleus sp. T3B2]|uniref:hypothetical protein n=1 Tax=Microcoleus sp. T3B2 TaxID=3055426 RepID=UPI002FD78555
MPVPHKINFLKDKFSCGTGILPVPKRLIENGATYELKLTFYTLLKNGQDARSTKDKFSCGTGILPVPKRLPFSVPRKRSETISNP